MWRGGSYLNGVKNDLSRVERWERQDRILRHIGMIKQPLQMTDVGRGQDENVQFRQFRVRRNGRQRRLQRSESFSQTLNLLRLQ